VAGGATHTAEPVRGSKLANCWALRENCGAERVVKLAGLSWQAASTATARSAEMRVKRVFIM